MSSEDQYKNRMLEKALIYQQQFYELLPDWTVYTKENIKYLKQNVGYAIFGLPINEKSSNSKNAVSIVTENITDDMKITDLVRYGSMATKTINLIVDQIFKYSTTGEGNTIKCGIIYVMIIDKFNLKNESLVAIPVFKILTENIENKKLSRKSNSTENMFETMYIDIKGRIYKDWGDYLMNNQLPECIIVYPKDGFYQPDHEHSIMPNYIIVWVEATDSKACRERYKIISIVDTTTNIISTGASVALGITALCTPVAPVVLATGVAVTGLSSIWTIGKCSSQLYDKAVHGESISPFNKSALSDWLGIAGSTVAIAATGGKILLSSAARSGKTVGTVAKCSYNAALIGSISINLIGVGYEGFNIYKKYKETGDIRIEDLIYLGTHLLFFVNSIIDVKFANEIIQETQGRILHEYEANLRNDNMKKRYEYIQNKMAANGGTKIEQNAGVIRYINEINMANTLQKPSIVNKNQNLSNIIQIQQYKVKCNGITLIDPILFVVDFAKSYVNITKPTPTDSTNSESIEMTRKLMQIIEKLLTDLYVSENCPKNKYLPTIPDFAELINKLKNIDGADTLLPLIFNIALPLVKKLNIEARLVEGCHFVLDYIKSNMYEAGLKLYSKYTSKDTESYITCKKQMHAILTACFNAIESMTNRFLQAFYQYLLLVQNHAMGKPSKKHK